MTDGFLKLSNIQRLQLKRININKLAGRMIGFVSSEGRGENKDREDVFRKVARDLCGCRSAHDSPENIFDNSLNAMDGKGTLNISTRLVESLNKKNK